LFAIKQLAITARTCATRGRKLHPGKPSRPQITLPPHVPYARTEPLANAQSAPISAAAPRKISPDHEAISVRWPHTTPPHTQSRARQPLKFEPEANEPRAAPPHRTGAERRSAQEIFKSGGVHRRRANSSTSDSLQRPALPPSPTSPAGQIFHIYKHRRNSLLRSRYPHRARDADPASLPARGSAPMDASSSLTAQQAAAASAAADTTPPPAPSAGGST
jgi:hypothetical protein